jgi:hypothetical protein
MDAGQAVCSMANIKLEGNIPHHGALADIAGVAFSAYGLIGL